MKEFECVEKKRTALPFTCAYNKRVICSCMPAHLFEALAEGLALPLHRLGQQMLHVRGHILLPVLSCHCHLPALGYEIHHQIGFPKVRLLLHLQVQRDT